MYRQVKDPSGDGFLGGPLFVCASYARPEEKEKAAVPAMRWDRFSDAYPKSHLVVAWLNGHHRTGQARRTRLELLKRIATTLKPRGAWALTDAKPAEIYIAYVNAADAAQLCRLARAQPLGPSSQWLSQAAFRLEGRIERLILDAEGLAVPFEPIELPPENATRREQETWRARQGHQGQSYGGGRKNDR